MTVFKEMDMSLVQHPPHRLHNLRLEPESRNHHYSFHEYQPRVADGRLIHWPREPELF